ncbi:MAG: TIGR03619 family F420-dependent LLM class oxidoreductase [Acidimicrobiaceae bacterium]|nr:TIGR03619 family F420-dependent LLM class oxidoreductase [Acidimicrobiaceae bacterium]MYG54931.1 TIGR03619 family F420-dependent LLM class oxidoreductase [Acidimicrobiaceae bacterium]MYJ98555.1 TIGR03619 family F420-dependent LLM class oxidoreductase [Acidimicrobiaceae bacterium]
MPTTPILSAMLITFSADDPGGWTHLVERAKLADRAGIDRLALADHVVFGENLEAYSDPKTGGLAGGRQPTGPDGHWLEPLTTIAHMTAVTERVRFITGILIAALRRPVVLAKTLATIDVLSGGRVDLGVGVGWQREEYEAAGLDYRDRGAQLNHTLEVCQTLWSQQVAEHSSDRLQFSRIHQMPKPSQAGGVPIWVSGTVNKASMRRLARFGTGWIPWGPDAADIASGISKMRTAVRAEGRDPGDIEVVSNLRIVTRDDGSFDIEATMSPVPRLIETGVTDFRLGLGFDPEALNAEQRIRELVAGFDAVTGR